jgi:hypothetical protein
MAVMVAKPKMAATPVIFCFAVIVFIDDYQNSLSRAEARRGLFTLKTRDLGAFGKGQGANCMGEWEKVHGLGCNSEEWSQ